MHINCLQHAKYRNMLETAEINKHKNKATVLHIRQIKQIVSKCNQHRINNLIKSQGSQQMTSYVFNYKLFIIL